MTFVKTRQSPTHQATETFRVHGGIMRMADVERAGISRRTLYQMRDSEQLEQMARGLYRLADLPPLSEPDLLSVVRERLNLVFGVNLSCR